MSKDKMDLILEKVGEFDSKATAIEEASKSIKGSEEFRKEIAESTKKSDAELKALSEEIGKLAEEKQAADLIAKNQQSEIDRLTATIGRAANSSDSKEAKKESEYLKSFRKYLVDGKEPTKELINEYHKEALLNAYGTKEVSERIAHDVKTLATDVGPNGGYFIVQPQRVDQTITRIFETDPMRAISNVISTASPSIDMIIDDEEITALETPGEREARAASATPNIGVKEIYAHELYKSQPVTQKMLDTYPRIESWILNKLDKKFSRTENQLFVSGTGSKEAKGFNSYGAWAVNGVYQRNALENITDAAGASGVITKNGLIQTQGALIGEYQTDAKWLMQRASWTSLLLIEDAEERGYILDNLRDGAELRLLGKPVLFSNSMEAVANSAKAIAYGDFGVGYTIVDQIGMRISRDPFTSKPLVLFDAYKRVGGDLTSYESIKINKLKA